jgi:hypothetical protein
VSITKTSRTRIRSDIVSIQIGNMRMEHNACCVTKRISYNCDARTLLSDSSPRARSRKAEPTYHTRPIRQGHPTRTCFAPVTYSRRDNRRRCCNLNLTPTPSRRQNASAV